MTRVAEPTIEYPEKRGNWKIRFNLPSNFLAAFFFYEEDFSIKPLISSPKTSSKKSGLNFSWEGGLKELKKDFDGVKLQHYINTLRK